MREGCVQCGIGLHQLSCRPVLQPHVDTGRSMPPMKQGREQYLASISNPPGAQQLDDLISPCSLFAPSMASTRRPHAAAVSLFPWLAILLLPSLYPSLLLHLLMVSLEVVLVGIGNIWNVYEILCGGLDKAASVMHSLCLPFRALPSLLPIFLSCKPFHAYLKPPPRTNPHYTDHSVTGSWLNRV